MRPPNDSEERFELMIGNVLRAGVLASAAVVLTGAILYLFKYGRTAPHYAGFEVEADDLRHVTGIIGRAFRGSARGIIQAGLLLLIATPIARVITSVFVFAREKDRLYVAATLVVLAVLLFSLLGTR